MANIANIILQAGGVLGAMEDYEEKKAGRAYTNRLREHEVKKMDDAEAERPQQRQLRALKADLTKAEYEYEARTKPQERAQADAMRPGKYDLEFGKQQDGLMDVLAAA